MSAPTPAAPAEGEAPKKKMSKKIIIIAAVAAVVLLGGGGAAVFIMKKKAAEAAAAAEADGGDGAEVAEDPHPKGKDGKHGKDEHALPPAFVPVDPFIVNLSDQDKERFAQITINLQVEDAKVAEEIKLYMPSIRNAVLMLLTHKSSEDLLSQEGKEKLAGDIRREAARAMGYEVEDPEPEEHAKTDESANPDAEPPKKKKKKKKKAEPYNPIVKVHYANFIIQ